MGGAGKVSAGESVSLCNGRTHPWKVAHRQSRHERALGAVVIAQSSATLSIGHTGTYYAKWAHASTDGARSSSVLLVCAACLCLCAPLICAANSCCFTCNAFVCYLYVLLVCTAYICDASVCCLYVLLMCADYVRCLYVILICAAYLYCLSGRRERGPTEGGGGGQHKSRRSRTQARR